ncbi:MAG TPA: TadE/TadG family type IV pilus assembly protein [Acidobacteriaceae bacterium]|jgi:Flp pilus assembly protein TadG
MIEFALTSIVALSMIFGVMDFCRAMYVYHFVSYAAQEGTRYAIVRGSHWSGTSCTTTSTFACQATSANVTSFVQSIAPPGISANSMTVTTTWPGQTVSGSTTGCSTAQSAGCLVQVKVNVSFNFILPFLPKSAFNFSGTSEKIIQE